jgi:hypothetical protein
MYIFYIGNPESFLLGNFYTNIRIWIYKVPHIGWACDEREFRGSRENKEYIKFYHTTRAAAARARGPCNMARQLDAT